jgi:hypothetical protein
MPRYDAYVVRIWRSTTSAGRQWAARVQHLPGGEIWRFSDPGAFLGYMASAAADVTEPLAETGDSALDQGAPPPHGVQRAGEPE